MHILCTACHRNSSSCWLCVRVVMETLTLLYIFSLLPHVVMLIELPGRVSHVSVTGTLNNKICIKEATKFKNFDIISLYWYNISAYVCRGDIACWNVDGVSCKLLACIILPTHESRVKLPRGWGYHSLYTYRLGCGHSQLLQSCPELLAPEKNNNSEWGGGAL